MKLEIKIPTNWRKGQTIFNFLEWLATEKEVPTNQSSRMADVFHLSDEVLEKYIKEYENLGN
jgi:hypothetical protein